MDCEGAVKSLNLNSIVHVTLSERGAKIASERMYTERVYAEGDELREQLWCLMAEFGEALTLGSDPPFYPLEIRFADAGEGMR